MKEAITVFVVLVVGCIWGAFLRPTEEQTRPIVPTASPGGGDAHADPGHH